MQRLINTKVVRSGSATEVYKYSSYKKVGKSDTKASAVNKVKRNSNTTSNSDSRRKADRAYKKSNARREIIRLAWCNLDLTTFITLTYKDNYSDINKSKEHIAYFIKKLSKDYPLLKYLYVMELQNRGAIHYHIMCNLEISSAKYQSSSYYRYINQFKDLYWNRGRVDIKAIALGDQEHIAKYMAKNLTSLPKGVKAYTTSQNLNKPNIEYDVTNLTHNDFMSGSPSYHTAYETKYTYSNGEEHESKTNYYRYN